MTGFGDQNMKFLFIWDKQFRFYALTTEMSMENIL